MDTIAGKQELETTKHAGLTEGLTKSTLKYEILMIDKH